MTELVGKLINAELKYEGRTELTADEARPILADVESYKHIKASMKIGDLEESGKDVDLAVEYLDAASGDIQKLAVQATSQSLHADTDKFKDNMSII